MALAPPLSAEPWNLFGYRRRGALLTVLCLVTASNIFDKNIVSVLLEPIKREFQVSDTMLGLLSGFSFALFYALAGVPVARWADRGNRRTVITLALTTWSLMTIFCGFAQTFWQLVLARVGVGAGESGAIPPSHSLIADYFPPERRATAVAIFTGAGTVGLLLAISAGGYIAATYGWRTAFMLAGIPGLLLALIARLTLAEPRLTVGFPGERAPQERLSETLTRLRQKKSFLYALTGMIAYTFVVQGGLTFIPVFIIRVQHISLVEVSTTYGGVAAGAILTGTLCGGWLADWLSQRDVRWLAWLPAIWCILGGVLFELALLATDYGPFLKFAFVANFLAVGGYPPIFAAILATCGSRRRAMSIALVYFSATFFGSGFGPLVTGAISDALRPAYGNEGLRYALIAVVTALAGAGSLFYACGCAMPKDLEG